MKKDPLVKSCSFAFTTGYVCAFLASLLVFYTPRAAWAFWPMFKQNPQRTGQAEHRGTVEAGIKWIVDVEGFTGYLQSPVIGKDGTIYIPGASPERGTVTLNAVSPEGNIVRRHRFPAKYREPATTPAISKNGKVLYFFTVIEEEGYDRGVLYALSIKKWKVAWKLELEKRTSASYFPLLVDKKGNIYVSTAEYRKKGKVLSQAALWAVSRRGKLKWAHRFKGKVSAPAISRDGKEIFIFTKGTDGKLTVVALSADNKELWRFGTTAELSSYATPTVGKDGAVYLPGERNTLYGLRHKGKGKFAIRKYRTNHAVELSNASVSNSNTVYVDAGSYAKKSALVSFDKQGGKRWEFQIDKSYMASAPSIDNEENVYFQGSDGFFYCLDKKGSLVWRIEISKRGESYGNGPAIGEDGTIYIVGGDGRLYAIGAVKNKDNK